MRTWTWTNRDEIEDRRCHRTSLELAARPTDPLNALAEPGTMETYMGEASALDGLMRDIDGTPDDVRRETVNGIGFEQDADWGNR